MQNKIRLPSIVIALKSLILVKFMNHEEILELYLFIYFMYYIDTALFIKQHENKSHMTNLTISLCTYSFILLQEDNVFPDIFLFSVL